MELLIWFILGGRESYFVWEMRMNFSELIRQRYSVRAYQIQPVEADKLAAILEAARLAPTAANQQPFRILVIDTKDRQEELKQIYRRDWFSQAPLVLCVCGVPSEAWVRRDGANYLHVDAAIVMDHIILQATDLGLGTCWIASFDAQAARRILGLPEGVEPLLFTPLGYPADQITDKERKSLSELVHTGKW
jgi:nitroreductase